MFRFMGKEINAIFGAQTILIWTYVNHDGTVNNSVQKIRLICVFVVLNILRLFSCMAAISEFSVASAFNFITERSWT